MIGKGKEIGNCNRSATQVTIRSERRLFTRGFPRVAAYTPVPEPSSSLSNAEPILDARVSPGAPSTHLPVRGAGKRARPSRRRLWIQGFLTPPAAPGHRLPPARAPAPSQKRRLACPDAPGSSRPPPPLDSRPSAGPAITHGLLLRIRREHRSPEVQLTTATTNHADALLLHHLGARAWALSPPPLRASSTEADG